MSRATIENALYTWVSSASGLTTIWTQEDAPRPPTGAYIAMRLSNIRQVGLDWVETTDNPFVIADDTVESVSAAANTLTLTAHGLLTGDGPVRLTSSGTLPGGLATGTDYWVIKVDANTIKLATSLVNALAGTPIDITGAGTGTHTLSDTSETRRVGQEVTHTATGTRRATLTLQAFGGAGTGDSSPAAVLDTVQSKARLPTARDALLAAGIGIGSFGPVQSIDGVLGTTLFDPRAILAVELHLTSQVSEFSTFIERVQLENEDTGSTFEVEV